MSYGHARGMDKSPTQSNPVLIWIDDVQAWHWVSAVGKMPIYLVRQDRVDDVLPALDEDVIARYGLPEHVELIAVPGEWRDEEVFEAGRWIRLMGGGLPDVNGVPMIEVGYQAAFDF